MARSSLHFVRGFALLDERLPLGGVTPPDLARPVVGVAHGRRAGEAGRGAAAAAYAAALAQLLARRRGAERALQGGRGAARPRRRRRAEQHPVAVLHQLREAGQEVGVARAAGPHPQAPSSGRGSTAADGDDEDNDFLLYSFKVAMDPTRRSFSARIKRY